MDWPRIRLYATIGGAAVFAVSFACLGLMGPLSAVTVWALVSGLAIAWFYVERRFGFWGVMVLAVIVGIAWGFLSLDEDVRRHPGTVDRWLIVGFHFLFPPFMVVQNRAMKWLSKPAFDKVGSIASTTGTEI